jgi:hypothetical protein
VYTPRILHSHPFQFSDIDLQLTESEWRPTTRYESLASAAWQTRLVEETAAERQVWDGTYYRAINAQDLNGSQRLLRLRLGTIKYRYIATFRSLHQDHAAEGLEPLHHLSTAALIQTTDGQYMFGRRSRNGLPDLIGGGLQLDELIVARGADFERNLRKEMQEEAGIADGQIVDVHGLGAFLASTSNVLILGTVTLSLSRSEAEEQFSSRTDDEMSEPIFVERADLDEFLSTLTDFRPLISGLIGRSGK